MILDSINEIKGGKTLDIIRIRVKKICAHLMHKIE